MLKNILLFGGAIIALNSMVILIIFRWRRISLSLLTKLVFGFQIATGLALLLAGIAK